MNRVGLMGHKSGGFRIFILQWVWDIKNVGLEHELLELKSKQ